MKKSYLALAILLILTLTILSNEYFEDKIWGENKKVLGISKEERFFLPFPKDYELVSTASDQRTTTIVINVQKPAAEIKDFYKEILRSKEYENDYEYEKDNLIEFRYIKENEDLKITISQEGLNSIVEFNYHK